VYTFYLDPNYSRSYIGITITDEGSTDMDLGGALCATIYASDGHIGSSDTFTLGPCCAIANTTAGKIEGILGLLTANVGVGDLQLIGFCPNEPPIAIHIGEGGEFSDSSGAHVSAYAKVVVTGIFTTTATTTITSEVVHISGTITTSGEESDTILLNLNVFASSIWVFIPAISQSVHLVLDAHIEATAHMTPDPTLGGLIALGLGGAGTWLRRRRRV
jgi:hypothetical protein